MALEGEKILVRVKDNTISMMATDVVHCTVIQDDPWEITTPMESISTLVQFSQVGSSAPFSGYSLGHSTYTDVKRSDGVMMRATVVPKPKPIHIAPGKSHDFEVPFERDWSGHVVPGHWNVWIEDEGENLISNKIEIRLRFTADSIFACLQKASDESRDVLQREFYAAWLQEILPELNLRWPSGDKTVHEQRAIEIEIKQELQAFKLYLGETNNAQAIEAAMQRINRGNTSDTHSRQGMGTNNQ